jgi:alpha-tubulin suppressor-like RCC1 family protein
MLVASSLLLKKGKSGTPAASKQLYAWGYADAQGAGTGSVIGDGTVTDRSLPTHIGSLSWKQVAMGFEHTLAIRSDGLLFAWGDNSYGELGNGTLTSQSSPIQIGTSSWTVVSAGYLASAGIRSDGLLFAWGDNSYGQQGNALTNYLPQPVGALSWNAIAAGASHVLAIRSDGALFAWGDNSSGQLGDGTTVAKSSPVQIGTSSWTVVSAGQKHTLALLYTGIPNATALYAWGDNSSGQLGDGTTVSKSSPVHIGTSSWSSISAGQKHTLALLYGGLAGALYAWGDNSSGQLGDGTTVSKSSPVHIGTSSWAIISAGDQHSLGILVTTGALYAWGNNASGQLGDGTTTSKSSPVHIGTSSWNAISAGYQTSMARQVTTGALYTWGQGAGGAIGDGSLLNYSSPVQIGASISISWNAIAAGYQFKVATIAANKLYSWGDNTYGELGLNYLGTAYSNSPVQIGTSSWSSISSGYYYNMGILKTGALFGWGYNGNLRGGGTIGNLGDGTNITRYSPVQIGTSSWLIVSAGPQSGFNTASTAAIDVTGRLFTWGENGFGQLGDGTSTSRSSPVQIGTSTWSSVAALGIYMAGILSTGALFLWGNNFYGNLGDGTTVSKSSPVQIGTSSWSTVTTGQAVGGFMSTAAIDATGRLFTWGYGDGFTLGDGTVTSRSSPVQVGTSSWTSLTGSAGGQAFAAITT